LRWQVGKIENLIYRNLLGDSFGLEGVADGVGRQSGVDPAVRRLGALVVIVDFPR